MILCIYKIAAVCNSNDLLSCESSEMAFLSVCVCDSHRKSGDSDLSDKKEGEGCEWAKEVAFHWEEHLHIQLYWDFHLHYLPSTSQPLWVCTRCQCTLNLRFCELFISFKSGYVNHTYSCFSMLYFCIYVEYIWCLHHQILLYSTALFLSVLQLSKNQHLWTYFNMMLVIFFLSAHQQVQLRLTREGERGSVGISGPRAF